MDFNSWTAVPWKALPRLLCDDGWSISVQAGVFSYSIPRSQTGPYTSVECGFPSEMDEHLQPFAEDPNDPTGTVYPYVPIEIVINALAAHGGVVGYIKDGKEYKSEQVWNQIKLLGE